MEPRQKGILRSLAIELRHELEGRHGPDGRLAGDLERRLGQLGVWRDRPPMPADEVVYRSVEDREARRMVDEFCGSRPATDRAPAIDELVREAAYTWANRLLALRCLESRALIDEVILQKEMYGGRSLQHHRLARRAPERCAGVDEGLFAVLFGEFERRAQELPLLFDPAAPFIALRPSVAAIKRCIALLSGTLAVKAQERATDEVFAAPDALGWAYQYWNHEEKDRVFERVRTKSKKGVKIQGADIIAATCIYTEPYIVKFLVQNSLGALWMGMHPQSRLCDDWDYYVPDGDRAPIKKKAVRDIAFLDPACGSGHFLIEAFDLLYAMYVEEGEIADPGEICSSILERNLFGIDIDERAVQIAALALYMKAKERAPGLAPRVVNLVATRMNLVATNIRLPAGHERLEAFLHKHPQYEPLKGALLVIFDALANADQLGALLEIEAPVDIELWKCHAIDRVRQHLAAEAQGDDIGARFFGQSGAKSLSLVDLLGRRYDVVATNPPYMGSKNMGDVVKRFVECHFAPGKRDLYAAFILRCLRLAAEGGRVAMVTQQSWMFLRSYADLRALDDKKRKRARGAFRGLLRDTTIETLAHLGEHAFADPAAAGAFVTIFVLARTPPLASHRLTAFRLVGPKSPEEKDALLREAIRSLGRRPACDARSGAAARE